MLMAALTKIKHPKEALRRHPVPKAKPLERNPGDYYHVARRYGTDGSTDGNGVRMFLCKAVSDNQDYVLKMIEPKD